MKKQRAARAMDHLDDSLILGAMDQADLNGSTGKKSRILMWRRWVAIAAAFAILLSGSVIMGRLAIGGSGAVIALDVNPSMEIEINNKEKVVEVRALNEDATTVIGGMELRDVSVDVAINAIIGSMLKNGYLSADQNSILISVDAKGGKSEKLREKLSVEVGELLRGSDIDASVITQSYDKEGEVGNLANENNISTAKATLISKIVASGLLDAHGVPYRYETLAELNVNELKLILESKSQTVEGIVSSGKASGGRYITSEEALDKALADLGLAESELDRCKIEMDFEDELRAMVYELELLVGNTEYEYEIHAETGEILAKESEQKERGDVEDDKDEHNPKPSEALITREQALNAAYIDAGVSSELVKRPEIELDREGGVYVYEIEFHVGNMEYEYKIHAESGEVLEKESERDD